jgi:hypothetical protein
VPYWRPVRDWHHGGRLCDRVGTRLRLRGLVAIDHSPQRIVPTTGTDERTLRRVVQRLAARVPEGGTDLEQRRSP